VIVLGSLSIRLSLLMVSTHLNKIEHGIGLYLQIWPYAHI
jgi:hypothetical protein